jgi:hypothetical protein
LQIWTISFLTRLQKQITTEGEGSQVTRLEVTEEGSFSFASG